MDDREFEKLILRFGRSWAGYRKVRRGVKKRIVRHMHQLNCRHIDAYVRILERDPSARKQFKLAMTVSISRFYRDPELWQILEKRILPDLAAKQVDGIRAWSAGCARGEECYSLNMVWRQVARNLAKVPSLSITATDLNPAYLEMARKGIFARRSLRDLPAHLRSCCFISSRGRSRFSVKPEYRENIRWEAGDIFTRHPKGPFEIIFLRNNLLTYHETDRTIPVLKKIVKRLAPSGYLVVGNREKLPLEIDGLKYPTGLPYLLSVQKSPISC